MKKFFPLCLLLIVALVWTVSVAGSFDNNSTASFSKSTKVENAQKTEKTVESTPVAQGDEMTPEKAARIAAAQTGEATHSPAEALQGQGTPSAAPAAQEIQEEFHPSPEAEAYRRMMDEAYRQEAERTLMKENEVEAPVSIVDNYTGGEAVITGNRMEELKADGIIDASERAEYEQLLSQAPVIPLPEPFNTVSEIEPNNTCDSAQAIACGDTVWCATQTSGTDDHDWYTFTLAASQNAQIQTYATGGSCDPAMSDTYIELWSGDCSTLLGTDDDGGSGYFSKLGATLTAGTYAIHVYNYYGQTGSYHLALTCCDGPVNDDCASAINLGGVYPIIDTGTTVCSARDCAGLLDWDGVWYTFDLPYAVNNIAMDICPTSTDLQSVGIVIMPDCACTTYTLRDAGGFGACASTGYQGYSQTWNNVPGPATIYWPAYAVDSDYHGVDFEFTIDVTPPPDPHDCTDPVVVPAIPYADYNNFTCGRLNSYDATCLGSYDGGEDIIYEFTLAQDTCIVVTIDFKATTWTGFLIDDTCPPDPTTCIFKTTGSASGVKSTGDLALTAGTYYIMPDTWPTPNCIPDFDLTIDYCAPPPQCDEDQLDIEITTDGYPGEITWDVTDHFTSTVICSGGPYSSSYTTYNEVCCLDSTGCYDFNIYDAYGDGGGPYNLYLNGTLIYSGDGNYGLGESVEWIGNGANCVPPVGACCVCGTCVADNIPQSECDGIWYEGETCGTVQCPTDPWCCPPNTIWGQTPDGPSGSWSFGTSEIDVNGSNYKRFESFVNGGEITDVHFWGAKLFLSGSWADCAEEPMTFLIEFWNDDGTGYPDITNGPVCTYTMALAATVMDSSYAGYTCYSWDATLPQPCTLSTGYVSIQGQLDNQCWFLWLSSSDGDGYSWFLSNGVWTDYFYDNAVCLTGTYIPVYGACCDDATSTCTDNVEALDCPAPMRFAPNTLCVDMQPPCGQVPGACCDPASGMCVEVGSDSCTALGWNFQGPFTTCDPNPCPFPPVPNDSCYQAISVTVPSTTFGWTVGATTDVGFPNCGSASISSPGVWYSVIGTGNTMTASLCDGVATWDTKLSVFCPPCDTISCVDGNDDFCGLQSEVTWCSGDGQEYLILVHGYGGATGPFDLVVTDDGVACSEPACLPPIGRCCYNNDLDCADVTLDACTALGGNWDDALNCTDNPCICPEDKVNIEIYTDAYPSETTWELYYAYTNVLVASGGPYTGYPNTLINEEVCVDYGTCFDFVIYDAFGDGICCAYGNGYYNVFWNDSLIATGGEFGSEEWTYAFGTQPCTPPPGACCFPDGSCIDNLLPDDCYAQGGNDWYSNEVCANVDCPVVPHCESNSMFSQNPDAPEDDWTFATSEQTPGYRVYDDFSGLTGPVGNIRFWGTQLHYDLGWTACEEVTLPFEIKLYPDNAGIPDTANPSCVYYVDIAGTATGRVYAGFATEYEFETDLDPCCDITDGWVSIQGQGDTACWFLWESSGGSTAGFAYQENNGVLGAVTYDLALCLMPCGGGGCDYTVGDVNGSDTYNGLDITYGVAYFKGGNEPICDTCVCPPHNFFWVCGDVNGSCSYNGLDITYGVAYFKGGPLPIACPDCPPAGITGGIQEPETPQVIKSKIINQKGSGLK